MTIDAAPVVGNWYRRLDRPQPFQVVAFDRTEGSIDIEYSDGTVDEWPISHWHELPIETCDAPQDWRGPFDAVDDGESDEQSTGFASEALQAPDPSSIEPSDILVVPSRSHVPGSPRKKAKTGPGRRR